MRVQPQRKRRNQTSERRSPPLFPLLLALIAIVSWASVLFSWMHRTLMNHSPPKLDAPNSLGKSSLEKVKLMDQGLPPPGKEMDLFPDDLEHAAFHDTLHSCTDLKKCKTFVSPETKIERIAILRPPGSIAFLFDTFVSQVVRLHSSYKMEFVYTSHVPPYGYGKTHGYTKIIRLATMPITLAAADLVLELVSAAATTARRPEDVVTLADVEQAMRQIVRWHCRLSHVSAHTALLTITLEDLMDDPWKQEDVMRSFLNLSEKSEESHIDEDELAGSMDELVRRATLLLMRLDQEQQDQQQDVVYAGPPLEKWLDQVIDNELSTTQNLKAWPCKSFWALDDITSLSRTTAALFSPNCTAPSNCWVQRDLCEERGDAKCPKQT